MGHMQPDIQEDNWYEVETNVGTEVCPVHHFVEMKVGETIEPDDERFHDAVHCVEDMVEGHDYKSIKLIHGFGARLSAPGFMDCTDWTVFQTEEDARVHIRCTLDVCPDCGADIAEDNHENCGEVEP